MNSKFRKDFLEDLPNKMRSTVRGADLILINKAITAILEERITINGRAPITRQERFNAISCYFKMVKTNLNMSFDMDIKPSIKVDIKYNETRQNGKHNFVKRYNKIQGIFKHY
jgi:hypothetical protein